MTGRTDAEWCAQLAAQPPDVALAELRSLLLRAMHFALAGYSVTESDLEDFVQDGLLKILQELPSYRGEARFTTWAQKVCVRDDGCRTAHHYGGVDRSTAHRHDGRDAYEQLDRFAELLLSGKNAAEALPLVQDHLERCGNCREEFEALLVALRSTQFPPRPDSYPP
jgi:hypothetical protein